MVNTCRMTSGPQSRPVASGFGQPPICGLDVRDTDSGERVADYLLISLLEDIRKEEKDDQERERGPTSAPGVHGSVGSPRLDTAPVVHTHIDSPERAISAEAYGHL